MAFRTQWPPARGQTPSGRRSAEAPREAIDTFPLISLRMWDEIAAGDPQPWKWPMKTTVEERAAFRHLQA